MSFQRRDGYPSYRGGMGRKPRMQDSGSVHHITVRGNIGTPVFLDNVDRRSFLSLLREAGSRADWTLLSYCLMTNHAHLLVRLGPPRLSVGMHFLNSNHSRRFNATHALRDHLFGQRFYSSPVESDEYLLEAFRYIALNPWRAGMTNDRDQWGWSAHRALAGLSGCPAHLDRAAALAHFDGDPERYRAFVSQGERHLPRPPLSRLARRGDVGMAEAFFDHGYTQRQIAHAFRLSQATVSRRLRE